MRRGFLIACAAALLLAAPAPATLLKVQITNSGFAPAHVTLPAGDSISWTNADSSDHRVVCKTCSFRSQTLKSHDTYAFTFLHPGTFAITDPLSGKAATVTVKKPLVSVTVAATPETIVYGKTAEVSGVLSSHRAGQSVEILSQACVANTIKVVAKVKSKRGGTFSYRTRPGVGTTFHVRFRARTGMIDSSIATVAVKPVVVLKRVARGKFSVRVVTARPLLGKAVVFQRFVPSKGRWVTSKVVVLDTRGATKTPLTGSTVSSAVFTTSLRKGLKVRAVLRTIQAIPCYATAWSATTHT